MTEPLHGGAFSRLGTAPSAHPAFAHPPKTSTKHTQNTLRILHHARSTHTHTHTHTHTRATHPKHTPHTTPAAFFPPQPGLDALGARQPAAAAAAAPPALRRPLSAPDASGGGSPLNALHWSNGPLHPGAQGPQNGQKAPALKALKMVKKRRAPCPCRAQRAQVTRAFISPRTRLPTDFHSSSVRTLYITRAKSSAYTRISALFYSSIRTLSLTRAKNSRTMRSCAPSVVRTNRSCCAGTKSESMEDYIIRVTPSRWVVSSESIRADGSDGRDRAWPESVVPSRQLQNPSQSEKF